MSPMPTEPYRDVDAARDDDPGRGAVDSPHHPSSERSRVGVAERRRQRMVADAMKRLRSVSPARPGPGDHPAT